MRFSKSIREKIETRANKLCEYCLCPLEFSSDPFSVEHIFPISKGGSDDLENLALACQGCNGYKSTKTEAFDAISQAIAKFYNPRKDVWKEHFVWNEDFTEIVGLTAKGRVTIKTLKLNRQRVINLRRILTMVGEHLRKIED
jgi:HNH endonuclease